MHLKRKKFTFKLISPQYSAPHTKNCNLLNRKLVSIFLPIIMYNNEKEMKRGEINGNTVTVLNRIKICVSLGQNMHYNDFLDVKSTF